MGLRRLSGLWAAFFAVLLLGGGLAVEFVTAAPALAAPPVINIGVDNATPNPCAAAPLGTRPPVCHNFEYTSFFPNGVRTPTITVHSGDIVNFGFNFGSADGFHTATLLPPLATGQTLPAAQGAAFGAYPLTVTDTSTGDAPGQQTLNPQVLYPSITSTVGAPGLTCGDSASNPCAYDGSATLNSGAFPVAAQSFFAQVNAPAGSVVPFVCLIHFGMAGQLVVVPTSTVSSTQADLDAQGAALYTTETADGLAQESALNAAGAAHTTNSNGTTNWTLTAGSDGANGDHAIQVLEMLPSTLTIKPGDTVTWQTTTTRELHTVTYPKSDGLTTNSPVYNAFPLVCEGSAGDTPPSGPPPTFGCGAPGSATGPELHGNFAPVGPTTISNPVTQATSGAITAIPGFPGGVTSTATYTFPNANSFSYQCTVHDHMYGTVNVVGAPGYREVASDGGVFAFGSSPFAGSAGSIKLNKPIVGGAATPDGKGYWFVASDGGIFAYGTAGFFGSTGSLKLNSPIVGMAATPDGGGYWLFAADGGVFNYGDAGFSGSTGGMHLNKPVVGGASSPDGLGYWMVASDGGIFNFGDAVFSGSAGGIHLNKPVVGMAATPSGGGYFLVASDGGIFNYGDAGFFGSTGGMSLNKPIVGIGSSITGLGYFLVGSDGGIFNYGDTTFAGSTGSIALNKAVVGILR